MSETEIRNKKYIDVEEWDNESILSGLMENQYKAFDAVKSSLGEIEKKIDLLIVQFHQLV